MPRSLINIIQDPSKAEARRLLGYKKKELPSYGQEEFETVKYKVGEQWLYQHLMLGCRGGAKNYFNQAKALYRHIKKEKLTSQTFRRLAV